MRRVTSMDEISVQLGKLIGSQDEIKEKISAIGQRADETFIQHIEMKNAINKIQADILDFKSELQPTVAYANDYNENKKKLIYGAWGIGVLGVGTIMTITKGAWEAIIQVLR